MPRLMIDPGHTGESDPGAVAGGLREADITLDIALQLRRLLVGVPGLEVRMTREHHRDLARPYSQAADLRARTDAANAWPADYYLSIHVNAASNTAAHGVETFHHVAASAEARRVAPIIHRHLVPLFRADRGVKSANFHVLRETRMPAVLVELGFLTNAEDRARLVLPSFRSQLAEALAAAVLEALALPSAGEPQGTPILGPPQATVEQAQAWARARGATETFIALAPLYWELAPQRGGVDPAVAYAQAAKETGFGRFGGAVRPDYHNPCGLKTRDAKGDRPEDHQRFPDWRTGVTAHLDHLALYAGAPGYPRSDTPDPRHFTWLRGEAATVEALGGAWAPSADYGRSIVRDYLRSLWATEAPEAPARMFPDVPADHWAVTAIRKAVERGLLQGYPDGTFRPEAPVTRAEFAAVLQRLGLG